MPIIVVTMIESMVPHDHVLKTSLDLSETIEIKDVGRHIQVHDACQHDGKTYLVGGATSLHSSSLGMDAFLFVYEDNQLIHVQSFGGMREDAFTAIHCGDTLVVAGYSHSADFLDQPVHHFHRAFVLELDDTYRIKRKVVVEDPFQSTIHGLDVLNGRIVAVGQVQRITQSSFLMLIIEAATVIENVFGGDGFDVFYDVLLADHIEVVGQTSSSQYGVTGPRAIHMSFTSAGEMIRRTPLLSSSESSYYYIDSSHLAGTTGGGGFVQERGTSIVQRIQGATAIEGRFGTTWFGQSATKGFIEGRVDPAHRLVQAFDDLLVLQKEGMLYEALLMIPHLFTYENQIVTYNNLVLEPINESFWEADVFIEQEVAYAGPYKVILAHKTTRRIPTCNVTATTYYHPVTVLCNLPFTLNGTLYEEALLVQQPGYYHLAIGDTGFMFEIQAVPSPVIEVVLDTQQVIAVTENESRMWMIPAAMFVLFVGKKYLG